MDDVVVVEVEVVRLNPTKRRGLVVVGVDRGTGRPIGLPSGRLRPGEDPVEAACRVMAEQTGISDFLHRPVPLGYVQYAERQRDTATLTLRFAVLGGIPNTSRSTIDFAEVDPADESLGARVEHPFTVLAARRAAAEVLEMQPIAPRLLHPDGASFTLADLMFVYQQVLGREVTIDTSNFRRKVEAAAGFVERVGPSFDDRPVVNVAQRGAGRGRPAQRYVLGEASVLEPPIRFSTSRR